jgi:hypothetical protein
MLYQLVHVAQIKREREQYRLGVQSISRCIYLFAIYGIVALPITVFICSFQYKYRVNLSGSTVQTSEQLVKSKSLEYVNNYAFLCIVMCILLIISGIEMNPGPSDSDLSSNFGSISSTSTTVSNFIHNSVSFLQLNIQSITPKSMLTVDMVFYKNHHSAAHFAYSVSSKWGKFLSRNFKHIVTYMRAQPAFRK